ncbi:chloride channel protein [Pedobacter sp. SYP-B3415]|uniref:chloride channel protein n=1 Tax=Pedobacter sp. SYP-B3415 TaxID=2496641 RepID=UPI00101BD4CB|nr:chloride channel protein [Pedobacter sp. SYP-B3415]
MYDNLIRAVDKINSYRKTKISNRNFLVVAAVIVGVLSGLAAALLKSLTHHIEDFLQTGFQWRYKYYLYLLFPLVGIFLSVLYARKFIVKGKFETGLTPLLRTISKRSSRVELHNIYSQIITAAVTVGFGGSTGLEAPVVTSGSSIGSNLGTFLGLSYREVTLLLACGAAGAIAGAFNSPIAGIVFAIEILLPEFTIPVFIPLFLASATGAVVARFFYNEQLFYIVSQGWETRALGWYIVLAGLIGLFAIYFIKANYAVKSFFYKIKSPYRKVLVGGLALGALVFLFPTLYGEGYITIRKLLLGDYNSVINNSIFSGYNEFPSAMLVFTLLTVFAKSVATLVTLGAGGNGGTFAPSLIIGGLIGFCFAYAINLSGLAEVNVGNFIVAGMAASLGSIMHAPLTGIFLIAEITGGYILMVPLMITTAVSYLISRGYQKHSIYTKPLADAGELLSHEDKDATVLNMMKLRYVIEKDFLAVKINDSVRGRLHEMLKSRHNLFPVLADNGAFLGLLYAEDLFQHVLNKPAAEDITVSELMQPAPKIVSIHTDLKLVLEDMEHENVWLLPVVNEEAMYVGFVSKTAIFNKYRALLTRQAAYLDS